MFKLKEELREWLEKEGLLEAYESNVRTELRRRKVGSLKREISKLGEGFPFQRSAEGREFWVAAMTRAPKKIGGMR